MFFSGRVRRGPVNPTAGSSRDQRKAWGESSHPQQQISSSTMRWRVVIVNPLRQLSSSRWREPVCGQARVVGRASWNLRVTSAQFTTFHQASTKSALTLRYCR